MFVRTYMACTYVQPLTQCTYVPAVCNNGANVGRVEFVHSSNQLQDGNGLLWDAKVRPSGVMKLLDLALLLAVLLKMGVVEVGEGVWWKWARGCGGSG